MNYFEFFWEVGYLLTNYFEICWGGRVPYPTNYFDICVWYLMRNYFDIMRFTHLEIKFDVTYDGH